MATNLGTKITSTLKGHLSIVDSNTAAGKQPLLLATCTGTPPTTANTFAHGCLMIQGDTSTGTAAVYQNTGSFASPVWTLFDTSLPGDTASSLIDTNSATAVNVGTTASAVNYVTVTNSATGAVSANAVTIAANGSDSAVSLTLVPKGATGIVNIGLATQTGAINVGIATTATTAGVNILSENGTASTQTVTIGGGTSTTSGGKVVNIANGVPGASTTNAVNIGAGGTTTGTVAVTVGSNGNAAPTTAIQGGSGATAITLTPQTTGGIVIGAAAGTGAITVGSSSGAQTTNVGTGAGISTVNIATGAAANKVTVGAASTLTSLFGTVSQPKSTNYIASETGSNNAIAGALTDASGTNIALAAGLKVTVKLGHTLQAGANTFNFNGGGAVAIKMHTNSASDLGTAYAATGVIELLYDGTAWLDMSQ